MIRSPGRYRRSESRSVIRRQGGGDPYVAVALTNRTACASVSYVSRNVTVAVVPVPASVTVAPQITISSPSKLTVALLRSSLDKKPNPQSLTILIVRVSLETISLVELSN